MAVLIRLCLVDLRSMKCSTANCVMSESSCATHTCVLGMATWSLKIPHPFLVCCKQM